MIVAPHRYDDEVCVLAAEPLWKPVPRSHVGRVSGREVVFPRPSDGFQHSVAAAIMSMSRRFSEQQELVVLADARRVFLLIIWLA